MKKFYTYLIIVISSISLAETIIIDGALDEQSWDKAYVIDEYFEVSPYTLLPAEEKTITKIFSNEEGIYVGFTNFQDDSTMLSKKSMRDETPNNTDQNGIAIDFDKDGQKAYMFQVTLANIEADGIKALGDWPKYDWDGDWEVATKKYDGYWVSEFLIPWNVVLMKDVKNEIRDINITTFRYVAKRQTLLNDSKTSAYRADFLSKMKSIQVKNFTKRKFNFFPFVSVTQNSVTKFDENKTGAEIFYNTGNGKQINLTLNPDFGQAESDEVIVNFSAQETFFSEKRAFFNENQSLFNLSHYDRYRVINTRRIGSASDYDCLKEDDAEDCKDSKKNYTDIDFALRYTQKINSNETGIFVAKEHDEKYALGKSFYALRSKQKVGTKTFGYFLTHVKNDFLNEKATVNVFDYTNVKSDKLTLYTDVLSSKKEGRSGLGLRSQFVYQITAFKRRSGSIVYFEDDFELNDFGYLKKRDWFHIGLGNDFTKVDFNKNSSLEEREVAIDFNYDSDTAGNSNPVTVRQEFNFTYIDTSEFQISWDLKTSGKDTTITRKNSIYPYVKNPGSFSFNLDYESPSYGGWEYDWRIGYEIADKYKSWESSGYERRFAKIAGSFYPVDNFSIGYSFRVREEDEWLNWIKGNELAVYDLTQKIISLNLNWYRGTKHEIRLKSQFVALDAINPKSLITNTKGYLLDHTADISPFTQGITSFQIRYKYEIAPLSNIYLVYTKGGNVFNDDKDRSTSQTFREPWNNPDNEILSLKFRLKF